MPDEQNRAKVVGKQDLGNGKKQITLSIDATKTNEYLEMARAIDAQVNIDGLKLGQGSVKTRYMPYSSSTWNQMYTSNQNPYTQIFNQIPIEPHQKMVFAMELYFREPIIGTVIDLMVDFSASGFTNDCDDQKIREFYDAWCKEVYMQERIEQIFLEFYRSGNVSIYKSDRKAKVRKSKKNKTTSIIQEYKFPAGYTVLNPLSVFVEGNLMYNAEIVSLQLSEHMIGPMLSDQAPIAMLQQIPQEILNAVKDGQYRVVLDPERLTRITRKKQPYERYASPLLERVFEPVLYKHKLREMDMSTIEGMVNQLITVTIGNDEYPATDQDLNAISELFNAPNKAYTVFWNHTLNVVFHKPEGIETLNQDKYKQVNEDIMIGLGISRVLLDGQGANFSTAWVSILSLIERLENARYKVCDWLEREYKAIADENGFKTYPKPRFNKMNLREDTYIRDVLMALYDRGLLDAEDILNEIGRDYNNVLEMKKRNEKNDKYFFPPEQPFQGGNSGPNGGGRAPGSGGNYPKRKTGPVQNQGNPPKSKPSKANASYYDVEEEYASEIRDIYDSIQADVENVVKEHKDKDNHTLEKIILATIIAMFKPISVLGAKYIKDLVDAEIYDYGVDDMTANKMKADLVTWNNSYVNKLANDIREKIITSVEKGLDIEDAVKHSFQTNAYRLNVISQSGVVESVRQAKIEANKALGNHTATWVTSGDDRVCATCAGLDGTTFHVNSVPPRPHPNCRCDLEFS